MVPRPVNVEIQNDTAEIRQISIRINKMCREMVDICHEMVSIKEIIDNRLNEI